MGNLWQKLDISLDDSCHYIFDRDEIYYAREYIAHGGYQASETNDLIFNFKKPPEKKTTLSGNTNKNFKRGVWN
jgi:hypothetical protein